MSTSSPRLRGGASSRPASSSSSSRANGVAAAASSQHEAASSISARAVPALASSAALKRPSSPLAASTYSSSDDDDSSLRDGDDDDAAAAAAALDAQLDAELLSLRTLRDEEVGIAPEEYDAWTTAQQQLQLGEHASATAAATDGPSSARSRCKHRPPRHQDPADADDPFRSSDEDDEEFLQLLSYKPRCTFASSVPHASALSPRADRTLAASAVPSNSIDEMDAFGEFDFAVDGRKVVLLDEEKDASTMLNGGSIHSSTSLKSAAAGSLSSRRPASSSGRSRPGTASSRAKDAIVLATSPLNAAEQAEQDGTESFMRALAAEVDELRAMIAEAPQPSQQQTELLAQGVDIAAWSRARREQLARESDEAAQAFDEQQLRQRQHHAAMLQQQQAASEALARDLAASPSLASAATPVATAASAEPSPTAVSSPDGSPPPPLDSSASPSPPPATHVAAESPLQSSPSPSPTQRQLQPSPSPSPEIQLPPLHSSSSLPSHASSVARRREREQNLDAFEREEGERLMRSSQALETLQRSVADTRAKEERYRAVELAHIQRREEKRLREIKALRAAREQEVKVREAQRLAAQTLLRERAALRREDQREHRRLELLRAEALKAAQAVAAQNRLRETKAMEGEDRRSTAIHRKHMAKVRETQAERQRLESLRLEAVRKAEAEAAAAAAEYARVKRAEAEAARIESERLEREAAERAAAEAARLAREEAERRRFEEEALRMKEEALRARIEAERRAAEEAAREAARRQAEAEEAERKQQEAIARELARQAAEEAERKAYFEKMRLQKEAEARAQAEAERLEREANEKRAREEAAEKRRQEKLERKRIKAAWRIQRLWRGARVRMKHPARRAILARRAHIKLAQFRAAQQIQALVRGWLLRRKLARIRHNARFGGGGAGRSSASAMDDEDEFDYGGIDPSFYTIDAIPDFDMQLPREAQMMLQTAAAAGNAGAHAALGVGAGKHQPAAGSGSRPGAPRESSVHSAPRERDGHDRSARGHSAGSGSAASSAGSSSKLSSSGRGGVAQQQLHQSDSYASLHSSPIAGPSSQVASSSTRMNNFFGGSSAQASPLASPTSNAAFQDEPVKFPRIGTPTQQHHTLQQHQERVSTADSFRSAEHSSREEPSRHTSAGGGGGTKAAKLAELSAAWGITDPRTLEAMLRKQAKLGKMKAAKRAANLTADQKLEHFHRVTGVTGSSGAGDRGGGSMAAAGYAASSASGGGGHPKKKRPKGVPASWLGPSKPSGGSNSSGGEDEDFEQASTPPPQPAPLHQQYRMPALGSVQGPPSPASTASLSSRSIAQAQQHAGPYSYGAAASSPPAASALGWMQQPSRPAVVAKKR